MKLMFASDLHGSSTYCEKMFDIYKKENAKQLILLGDLLYHGPRNDLPEDYAPKEVIKMLNENKEELLCVRGNCEAEVDQMVLEFPVLADYMIMYLEGKMAFITHGHTHNLENLPPLKQGSLLIHGHTHVLTAQEANGVTYLNPGSMTIPKNGNKNSYMIYEDGVFTIKDLEGNEILTHTI
ncbi:MAG: phosphodiesterase [bacterium]|nr:phosphodiesterase [bacterium]